MSQGERRRHTCHTEGRPAKRQQWFIVTPGLSSSCCNPLAQNEAGTQWALSKYLQKEVLLCKFQREAKRNQSWGGGTQKQ